MRREEKNRVREREREGEGGGGCFETLELWRGVFVLEQYLVEVCLPQELIECVEEGIALSGFDVPDCDGHL